MKMKHITRIALVALLLLLMLPALPAKAADPLDEIKTYVITVDMRQDGTMDIKYHLDWTVLDDTSEGPLTWVKVGIPNSHVDSVKGLSPNIADIRYNAEGGDYIRVSLDRPYRAGETVSFDFSIHQSYMYTLEENTCSYAFIPGWFEEINVKSLKVLWNKADVASSNAMGTENDYLTWETTLAQGERYEVKVEYPMGVFDTSKSMQATESGGSVWGVVAFTLIFFAFIARFVWMVDGYEGGFGRRGTHVHTHHSCACAGCACACACACAGGGRAGCSVKNFYGAKVHLTKLYEKLKQE